LRTMGSKRRPKSEDIEKRIKGDGRGQKPLGNKRKIPIGKKVVTHEEEFTRGADKKGTTVIISGKKRLYFKRKT